MNTGHKIKYRATPQDKFYTPPELAASLVPKVEMWRQDTICDPFRGNGAFYNAFPKGHEIGWAEVDEGKDFFDLQPNEWDWLISNPPYSNLDEVLEHSCKIARKGFAYLLLGHALTPKRLERIGQLGFGLVSVHLSKVFQWYGISAFCVFERDIDHIIQFDRKVWR